MQPKTAGMAFMISKNKDAVKVIPSENKRKIGENDKTLLSPCSPGGTDLKLCLMSDDKQGENAKMKVYSENDEHWFRKLISSPGIDRGGYKEFLNIALLVVTLVLSFSIGLQFNFNYEDLTSADQRYLAFKYGRSVNVSEVEDIYNSIVSFTENGCYDWHVPGPHGDLGRWSDYPCDDIRGLPSYMLYLFSAITLITLGFSLFIGIFLYSAMLLMSSTAEYNAFFWLTAPLSILMLITSLTGILSFMFTTNFAVNIIYGPPNAGSVLGVGYLMTIMLPFTAAGLVYVIISIKLAYSLQKTETKESLILKIQKQGLTVPKLSQGISDAVVNDLVKDAGIENANDRLDILDTVREKNARVKPQSQAAERKQVSEETLTYEKHKDCLESLGFDLASLRELCHVNTILANEAMKEAGIQSAADRFRLLKFFMRNKDLKTI